MIEVQSIDLRDSDGWESIVRQCNGNPMHFPSVHLVRHEPKDLRLLTFQRDGVVIACATAIALGSGRIRQLLRRQRILELPTSPALVDESDAGAIRDALLAHAADSGFDRVTLDATYGGWLGRDERMKPFRVGSVTEFVIDLRPGEEAVVSGIHKTHRKNARRAERNELTVFEDSSLDGLLLLRQMQIEASHRASERANGFGVPEEAYFHRLHEQVYQRGPGHVFFASKLGQPVAALAWIDGARRVLTVRAGSNPEGYRLRAMYLLYVELIRFALRQEMLELNAGGVPAEASDGTHPQSGLYEFKHGFGGSPVTSHALDVPLEEAQR